MDLLNLLMLHICPFKECPWSYIIIGVGIVGGFIAGYKYALSKMRAQPMK
jgi:hypothetical protein